MNKKLSYRIFIGLSLLLISCITKENSGYPRNIYIECTGGKKTITGNVSFPYFAIYENDDVASISIIRNDSVVVVYDWLTVSSKKTSNMITIVAAPNTNNYPRKLMLFGAFQDKYDEITIHQNGLK